MTARAMRVLGMMSGTSADGIDAALVRVSSAPPNLAAQLEAHFHVPFPPYLRERVLRLANGAASTTALESGAVGAGSADVGVGADFVELSTTVSDPSAFPGGDGEGAGEETVSAPPGLGRDLAKVPAVARTRNFRRRVCGSIHRDAETITIPRQERGKTEPARLFFLSGFLLKGPTASLFEDALLMSYRFAI